MPPHHRNQPPTHRRISTVRITACWATQNTQLACPCRRPAEYSVRRHSRVGGATSNAPRELPPPSSRLSGPEGTCPHRRGFHSQSLALYSPILIGPLIGAYMRDIRLSRALGPRRSVAKSLPNLPPSHGPFLATANLDVFSRITHGSPINYTHLVWKNDDL